METKANYVLIGTATVIGFLLIALFAMWLANASLRSNLTEYDVVFQDPVRGLAEGGEVRFNGIKVGEVKSLRIDPDNTNRVIARIRISSDVPLRTDSEAQLEPVGLTGVTLIQLSSGSTGRPLLQPAAFGPPTRIRGRGSQIDILVERSEDIALRASEAMAAVRDLLTDENIARVTRIINNLQTVSDRLAAEDSVINRSAETAQATTEAARQIATLARQTQQEMVKLDSVLDDVHAASQQASGQTLPEVTRATVEIRRAAEQIERVAANLDESPSVLTPRRPRPTVDLPQ
ncbi:MAG: MlaD family protein [Alphaproteobacteria bacterium]